MTEVFKRREKLIFIALKSSVTDISEATFYDQSIYSGILSSYADCQQGIQLFSVLVFSSIKLSTLN